MFDADFVPPADILLRMVPAFAAPRVGMVQARWTHLNRDESLLTRVQALFLDAHFAVESAARSFGGRFFNFNGTAGIWRRAAIEEAGGWSSSTLTEDLDLSYRAQLAGWEFVFLSRRRSAGGATRRDRRISGSAASVGEGVDSDGAQAPSVDRRRAAFGKASRLKRSFISRTTWRIS